MRCSPAWALNSDAGRPRIRCTHPNKGWVGRVGAMQQGWSHTVSTQTFESWSPGCSVEEHPQAPTSGKGAVFFFPGLFPPEPRVQGFPSLLMDFVGQEDGVRPPLTALLLRL